MVDIKKIDAHIEQVKISLLEYYKQGYVKKVKNEEKVKEIIWKVWLYNTLIDVAEGINDYDIEEQIQSDFDNELKDDKDFLELVELKEEL